MSKLHPVILCGGVGTRLWPLSRAQQPKQFQTINSDSATTFFQATVQRHSLPGYAEPIVCVNHSHTATVRRQLRAIGLKARIIAEPLSRNTGPALLATSLQVLKDDPDAVLLALPSDHVVTGDFETSISRAFEAAKDGLIIIFGIEPRYPETGYGYIIDAGDYLGYPGTRRLSRFVEKPPLAAATELIASGRAFWASGISMFRADVLVEQYRKHAPATYNAVKRAVQQATESEGAVLLEERSFAQASNKSTESEIFERTDKMALYPAPIEWDDVGAWSAFHAIGQKSDDGNVTSGDVLMVDTTNSYVRGGDRLIAVVGLTDIVIVDTADALLVTNRANSQNVKKVVEQLTAQKRIEVVNHQWLSTDWGRVGTLSEGDGFLLKQLIIEIGATVSFEPLEGKRSLITIAEGAALLDMRGEVRVLQPGDTVELEANTVASIANTGPGELHAVEVTCDAHRVPAVPDVRDLPLVPAQVQQYA